jgi:CubicO group peptidase (beta-lactamase class C family)
MRFMKAAPLAVLLLAPLTTHAADHPPSSPVAQRIENYARTTMKAWEVPGVAIAIVQDRKPVLITGLGVRELGGSAPMDADTVFTIASLTKAFTATAAAVEVDRGRIAWDGSIVGSLPEFRLYDPYVTAAASFRDLLCHRVGTDQHYDNGLSFTRLEMIRRLEVDRPQVPFRSTHLYHNILYAAAGEAVARSAGKPWEQHIRETFFEPLGMTSSSTSAYDLARAPNHSSSHLRGRDGKLRVDELRPGGWWSMDNHAPAGAINSTARDMARWLEFQLGDGTFRGKRIVSQANLKETHLPQVTYLGRYYEPFEPYAYGLGWELVRYGGEVLLWHTGLFRGQGSVAILSLERNIGVFVFANSRDSDDGLMHAAIAQWAFDRLAGRPEHDWAKDRRKEYFRIQEREASQERELLAQPKNELPSRLRPEDYVGRYHDEAMGDYEVSLHEGTLRLERLNMSEPYFATLRHWNAEAWLPTWNETNPDYEPGQLVSFTLDAYGHVRSLLIHSRGYPHEPDEFLRQREKEAVAQ